ncbi:acylphosphatase [archaeon]
MKRVRIIISGRVQGVFYRAAVCDAAKNFDVTGFVKNLPDGTVEVVAEGEESELKRFAGACKINDGPRQAQAVGIEYTDADKREHTGFSVAH